jgi:hypothetical protein
MENTAARSCYQPEASTDDCWFHRGERLIVDSIEDGQEVTYKSNMIKLSPFQNFQDGMVNKLKKVRRTLADHQAKLKEMRRVKIRGQQSIDTKSFKMLKEIGVELSYYHGGSLNGKDIKKVMNNASNMFDQFAAIFKGGGEGGVPAGKRRY